MNQTITLGGNDIDLVELWDYHRLARVALDNPSWLDRAGWAAREYNKAHPEVSIGYAYKALDRTRN